MKSKLTIILIVLTFGFKAVGQTIIVKILCKNIKESIPFVSLDLFKNDILISNETSDIEGNFKFKNIGQGDFKLISTKAGCKNDTTSIKIATDKEYYSNIILSCKKEICNEKTSVSDHFDFHRVHLDSVTVRQYVEMLKFKKDDEIRRLYIGAEAKIEWIKKTDIPYLMKFIESTKDAKCVMKMNSSIWPKPNESELGGQVMNLIDAYRLGVNYPSFYTACSSTDKKRIEEIKKWWETQK